MTSELFASIEGVGIRAFQLIREVKDSPTCYPKRMFISSSGSGSARALAYRSRRPRREPFSQQVVQTKSAPGRLARAPIAARESACAPPNRAFLLTKLCLIPPFAP